MAVTPTPVLELALRASYTRWPLLFSHFATLWYLREADLSIDQTQTYQGSAELRDTPALGTSSNYE